MVSSPDKVIGILSLFTLERPAWTVEQAASSLSVAVSSTYRYFATLSDAGLLTTWSPGVYVLGPAFIQYDRQIQLTDPLLHVSRPAMDRFIGVAPPGTTVVLCRAFGDIVLCVHQVAGPGPQPFVSYERGRPMPLFRGASSKIILAHLGSRQLRRLYAAHSDEIERAKLGASWEAFKSSLAKIRKGRYLVSHGEVDAGRVGISAPVLDQDRRAIGSLAFVGEEAEMSETQTVRLGKLVLESAGEFEAQLKELADVPCRY